MRFEPESLHGANNGLHVARGLMEKVKQEFPWISYGDLWTLAGVAALQVCVWSDLVTLCILTLGVGDGWSPNSVEAGTARRYRG